MGQPPILGGGVNLFITIYISYQTYTHFGRDSNWWLYESLESKNQLRRFGENDRLKAVKGG
jgi:hypothetical protein